MTTITVPEDKIELPEKLQRAISAAENTVSLLDAEAGRLKLLISSQKNELVGLATQKASLDSEIEELRIKKGQLREENSILQEDVYKSQKDLDDLIRKNKENEGVLTLKERDVAQREVLCSDLEKVIGEKEQAVSRREAEVATKEESIQLREEKIKKVLAQLQ